MHAAPTPNQLTPQAHAALIDAAKRRAAALRREAMDDCWAAAARATRSAWKATCKRLLRAPAARPHKA